MPCAISASARARRSPSRCRRSLLRVFDRRGGRAHEPCRGRRCRPPGAVSPTEEIVMRAAIVALVAFLLLAIALPLGHAAVEELPGRRGALRRPCQLRPLFRHADAGRLAVEQHLGGGAVDRHRRPAGVRLRLCAHAHAHAGQALFVALALLPLFAPSLLSAISLHLHLRQSGLPQGLADGRQRSTGRSASCWRRSSTASRMR